jgi:hypothetical protein
VRSVAALPDGWLARDSVPACFSKSRLLFAMLTMQLPASLHS